MRFEELEPRILYAADVALLLGAAGLDAAGEVRVVPAPAAVQAAAHEIVFVDARVPDAQQLVDDLLRQRSAGRMVEIVTLNAAEDGVQQIGRVLAGEHGLAAVHIVSHGSAGEVDIGSTRLDADGLAAHAAAIEAWRSALAQGADILLYGCDVADGSAGAAFAQQLARLAGADVAASTDRTGAAAAGGDWQLEFATGRIDAPALLGAAAQARWQGVLATYSVTSTTDNALSAVTPGTLRYAITQANTIPGADTINFAITGTAGSYGEYTITLASALPNITEAVTIDGSTQPGYAAAGHPLVVLDGNGAASNGLYLSNTADGSTVRGLVLRHFGSDGVYVQAASDNNVIAGNYIGAFNADGSNGGSGLRNGSYGVESYGANLRLGGTTAADRNVIAGNVGYAVYLGTGANGSLVQGNYIGLAASGSTVFGALNAAYGVVVETSASGITIGGSTAGAGNVVAGFGSFGIYLTTSGSVTVQGNAIGTDASGTLDLGNGGWGLYAEDSGSVLIGGTAAGAGNLVSGNDGGGLYLGNASATVQGNTIGLNAAGSAALGNTGVGIYVNTTAASTIGGATAGARNIVSGNSSHGIHVVTSPGGGHVIQGNWIGVGADGSSLFGNGGAGVYIAAQNVKVGGKNAGEGNTIAGNSGAGIAVANGNGNLFYRNAIFGNGGLGIDLGNDGVTPNDYNDGDGGANQLNNFPVITSVVTRGGTTTISGSVDGPAAAESIAIEFFSSPSRDASGYGEGKVYLGQAQVTTNAATGDATFSATLGGVSVGDWITAVANVETGSLGASEFAYAVQAVAAANAPRGKAIWNVNDRYFQQYADWSSTGFGGTGSNGLSFGDDISMIAAAEAPTRDEIIFIGSADASGKILAGVWNGSGWQTVTPLPLASPSVTASQYRSFDVAYDNSNGNAMLVWDNGNTGTTGLSYMTWNGSSWSAVGTLAAPVSGEPASMKLVASPNSHEMILAVTTTAASNNLYAMVWNGSSWGNPVTGNNNNKQAFELDAAYEQHSGRALVVFDASSFSSSDIAYRIWDGNAWGAGVSVGAPLGIPSFSELQSVVLASDPTSDRIAVAAKVAGNDVWMAVWDGNAWGDKVVATNSGVALTDAHPTMSLAFESVSGDLLAAYGESSGPATRYRTWTAGGGWSAAQTGPAASGTATPYIVKLYADPRTDTVMMGVQDSAGQLTFTPWDGSAWGARTQMADAPNQTYREPFTYVWYRNSAAVADLAGDTLAYTEGQAATTIDQGTAASVLLGDAAGWSGATLTVSLTAGDWAGEDVLSVLHQGNGAGQVGVSGATVSVGGVAVGSVAGGAGSNLVVTFNGNADDAAASAVLRAVAYRNVDTVAPTTVPRTVRFVVTTAGGLAGNAADTTVTVAASNDAPTALELLAPGAATNLLVNGSFETNNGTNNAPSSGTGVTVAGWTASGGEGFEVWKNYNSGTSPGPAAASDGVSEVELDVQLAVNGISQAVNTVAGQTYLLSFDFSHRAGVPVPGSAVDIYWRGSLVGTVEQTVVGWQSYRMSLVGSGGSDTLAFIETSRTNDGGGSLLDNVVLQAVAAPTFTLAENAANGSAVATARSVDADPADSATYSLFDSAGGRFAIDPSTGAITVANGSLLNYEAAASHSVTARVTDSGGATRDRVFTVVLTDVNEAPTAVADSATAVEAGGTANGTPGSNPGGNVLANDSDPDAGDSVTLVGVAAGSVGAASGNIASAVAGSYGSVVVDANGAYTYTLDNANPAVQALHDASTTLTDTFTYTVRDAAGLTSSTTLTVTIRGADDAPVLAGGGGAALAYTENDAATAVAPALTVADADSATLSGATVTITANYASGEDVLAFVAQNGISGSWNAGTGVLTLSGAASAASYQAALRSVSYANGSDAPSTATRTVAFAVFDDAAASSNAVSRDIAVTAVNDVPVNTLPATVAASEDTPVALTGLSISDPDAGSDILQTTLTVGSGTLAASSGGGVTASGSGTATLTLRGTLADLNAYLGGASRPTFLGAADANGAVTLSMVSADGRNSGSGGVLAAGSLDYRFQDGTPAGLNADNIPSTGGVTGVATNFDVGALALALTGSTTTFGVIYTGIVDITTAGSYTFTAGADDAARLRVDDTLVADAFHATASGSLTLTAGRHRIELRYFNDVGGFSLNAAIAGPDTGGSAVALLSAPGLGRLVSQAATATINVAPVDDAPVITSNGGGAGAAITVAENTTAVTTVTSSDIDGGTPVYSIAGGADAARFTIDANSGVLRFVAAPDFEAPADAGGNNVYDVLVQVSDGSATDTQAIAVTVTDVANTLVVTTTADTADGDTSSIEALNANKGADGRISLREALLAANQTANLNGAEPIGFDIPDALVGGVHTIVLTAALPDIADAVLLDASTEPDWASGAPVVVLDGGGTVQDGLRLAAGSGGSTLRGFVVRNFARNGIDVGSSGNTVAGNVVTGSGGAGIAVGNAGSTGNALLGNLIGSSGGLGIDLGATGVDANDPGDGDSGANDLQNTPVLAGAVSRGGSTTVVGTLNSSAGTTFRIEFFANAAGNASGHGEAQRYLGFATVTTDGAGNAAFSTLLAGVTVASGQLLTATATVDHGGGSYGSTSEFAANLLLVNHAPVLDASRSPQLGGLVEDVGAPAGAVGTLVSALVDFATPAGQNDNVTDADPLTALGIALTAADTSHGSWWYSLDNGANWLALGNVGDAAARLLAADGATRLYFRPNADWNGTLAAAIGFRAWDGTAGSNGGSADATVNGGASAFSAATAGAALTVSAVDDAPVLGYLSGSAAYAENAAPLLVAPAASVTDIDSPDFDGGQLVTTITANAQPEDWLTVQDEGNGAGQVGVSGSAIRYGGVLVASFNGPVSGGTALVVTFNANADAAAVQAVARRVSYQNSSDTPSAAARTIQGTLTDGDGGSSATTSLTLAVVPVNDAPVVNVVAPRTTDEDVVKVFSAFIGNAITVADADAGNNLLRLSVTASHGTVTLGHLNGLVFTVGDGTADTALTFTGTLAALNSALDGIAYRPDADYHGPAALDFVLDDLGNSGSGGAATATATQLITVLPVNDAPTLNDGTTIALAPTDEDTPSAPTSVASLLADGALGYADVDGATPRGMAVTATTGRGRWQFSNDGLAWADIGSVSAGNALLLDAAAQLRYVPDGLNGEAVGLSFRAWDGSAGSASTVAAPSFAAPGAGGGGSAFSVGSAQLSLAVASVDDAPTQLLLIDPAAPAQPVTVAENAANGTLVANAVATDPDTGDSIGYTLLDSAGGRFAIDAVTGALRVADGSLLDVETAAFHTVTVRATDSAGATLDRVFTIAVTDVNEAIVAVADSVLAVEAGGVANGSPGVDPAGDLFANDSDPDAGDSKTLVGVVAGNAGAAAGNVGSAVAGSFGTLTVGADGRYVYRVDNANAAVQALHDAATTLSDSFTYSVRDAAGLVSTARITVTIQGANDAPLPTANAGLAIAENATGAVIGNALLAAGDVDNAAAQLVYTLTAAPAHGTLRLAGAALAANGSFTQADIDAGRLTYDHDGSETTADGFAFTLDDGGGPAVPARFAITIAPVNDRVPVITSQGGGAVAAVTVAENTRAVTTVTASDADLPAQTLVFSIAGGADAARFTIDAATGALAFVTAPDYEAPADADGDGVYDVIVAAGDGTFSGTQALAVTVANVNEAPLAAGAPPAFMLDEDQPLAVTGRGVLAAIGDPDGDPLTAVLSSGPAHAGSFTLNADGSFHYTPRADWYGTDSFTFVAGDGTLTTPPITVVLTVRPVDDAPRLVANAGLTVAENSAGSVIGPALLAAADVDNSAAQLVFTLTGAPAHGGLRLGGALLGAGDRFTQADIDAGRLRYDHDGGETTADGFAFSVDDGAGGSVAGVFAITVLPVNDNAPVITSDGGGVLAAITVPENGVAVTTVTASDADAGSVLRFSIVGGADAARFTIDAATGALRFVVAPDVEAPADADADNVYDVVVQVSDGTLTGAQAIAVTVAGVNEAPVATAATLTFVLDEDQPLAVPAAGVLASVHDAEGDPLTARLLTGPAHAGAFTLHADGSFSYTPEADWSGSDSFTFSAGDGTFTTAPVTVVLTVRAVDDAPRLAADAGLTVAENSAGNVITAAMLATTDVEQNAAQLVYTLTGAPAHGGLWLGGAVLPAGATFTQADIDAGRLAYTHDGSETTADGFAFSVDDGAGGTLNGRFAIRVTPLDDEAPVIVSDGGGAVAMLTRAENGTAVTVVHATDADLPASALVYRIAGGADAALFAIDAASGELRFVAAPDFEAPRDAGADNVYEVTVEAFDGSRATQQRLRIAVGDVNEAPSSVDVVLAGVEDTPLHVGLADIGFRDADAGDRLGAVLVEAIGGGGRFALLAADGTATAIAAGQTIAAADIARLLYTPDADAHGVRFATLTLRVQDAAGLRAATASTLTIDVAAVVDAPVPESVLLPPLPGPPQNPDDPGGRGRALTDPAGRGLGEGAAATAPPGGNAAGVAAAPAIEAPPLGHAVEATVTLARSAGGQPAAAVRIDRAPAAEPVPDLVVELSLADAAGFGRRGVAEIASATAHAETPLSADAAAPEGDAADGRGRHATLLVQAARVAGAALTGGSLWWALRAGGLLASLLVVLPAWRHVDLLAVLPDEEDDDPWQRLGDAGEDDDHDEAARDEHAVRRVFEPAVDGADR